MLTNIRSWCNLHGSLSSHKGRLAYCSRRIRNSRNWSFSSLIGLMNSRTRSSPWHAMQWHSGGWGCPRHFLHWPNGVEGWYTSEHCCEDRGANATGMNPSKSSMYKYRREVHEIFHSTQPTSSTNLFNQPFRPTSSTNLLDQPLRPAFSTNKMRFILAIAAVLSALTMTNATHVSCQAGLSDTNICEKTYCLCDGNILTCQAGTTCANTCLCAAWKSQCEFLNRIRVDWVPQRLLILYSDMMATGEEWQSQVQRSREGDTEDVAMD